ncbi:hypothetical protein Pd630_LPD05430 [Rhodococcus opacus PD630]|nr:hypothetical protein Pd630_LPD05430 [Rhodococcus opacus PD630]
MQAAGHVGWRQHDGVARLGAVRVRAEVTGVYPALIQIVLDGTGVPALREGIGTVLGIFWSCTGHPSSLMNARTTDDGATVRLATGR